MYEHRGSARPSVPGLQTLQRCPSSYKVVGISLDVEVNRKKGLRLERETNHSEHNVGLGGKLFHERHIGVRANNSINSQRLELSSFFSGTNDTSYVERSSLRVVEKPEKYGPPNVSW